MRNHAGSRWCASIVVGNLTVSACGADLGTPLSSATIIRDWRVEPHLRRVGDPLPGASRATVPSRTRVRQSCRFEEWSRNPAAPSHYSRRLARAARPRDGLLRVRKTATAEAVVVPSYSNRDNQYKLLARSV